LDDGLINCDFPEPTDIRDIARAFGLWTGKSIEVESSVRKKVRLISPERVTVVEGERRFMQMLKEHKLKLSKEGQRLLITENN